MRASLLRWMVVFAFVAASPVWADAGKRAPGFERLASGAKLLVMPVDAELFELSAGGVTEPKADWTKAAVSHMNDTLRQRAKSWGVAVHTISEAEADPYAEQVALHAAVAESMALHHGLGGVWALPSKNGQLLWSFDTAMRQLGQAHGARYGLFVWVRDSYASAARKATMVLLALAGVGITGGAQIGYASLVDLETGQVLWFNRLARASGDLREAEPAAESMNQLLSGFPGSP